MNLLYLKNCSVITSWSLPIDQPVDRPNIDGLLYEGALRFAIEMYSFVQLWRCIRRFKKTPNKQETGLWYETLCL